VGRTAVVLLLALVAAPGAVAAPATKPIGPILHPPKPPSKTQARSLGRATSVLVSIKRTPAARRTVQRKGGTVVSPQLDVWRVPGRIVPELNRLHLIRRAEPVRRAAARTGTPATFLPDFPLSDPLEPQEWWLDAIDAGGDTLPGPAVPVTVVDTGLDTSHPEFAGRGATTLLDRQRVKHDTSEIWGTALASVIGAPANGTGIVGVYPNARLQSWDAYNDSNADLIAALSTLAARGPGVVNVSWASTTNDPLVEEAILAAVRSGSVVVAPAGDLLRSGNPPVYPASFQHVLAVGAVDEDGQPLLNSGTAAGVDLAAPGKRILAAVPLWWDPAGYRTFTGTGFAAAIVSGATAGIWSARPDLSAQQVVALVRRSARDAAAGTEAQTGSGILDVGRALGAATPPADSAEPNDDIYQVAAGGLFAGGAAPLTTAQRPDGEIPAGRLDLQEDPVDVYRVWVPHGSTVTVELRSTATTAMEMWKPTVRTVYEQGAEGVRDRVSYFDNAPGHTGHLHTTNAGRSAFFYWDVYLNPPSDARHVSAPAAAYTATVTTAARR
jgi:subtilisin family serine protease